MRAMVKRSRRSLEIYLRLHGYGKRRASIDVGMGQCDEAQLKFAPAIELNSQIGDWQHWGETMAASAQAAYFLGDFHLGFKTWSDFYNRANSRGDDLQKAWGLNGRAKDIYGLVGTGTRKSRLDCSTNR